MSMLALVALISTLEPQEGSARPGVEYRVFQFPPDQIPRIDGETDDWAIVPESYAIGMDQLRETVVGLGDAHDPEDLDVRVTVGWVEGLNQLYILYEATDDYWDFSRPDLHNDIFELVIDGDRSGGPFIRQMHPDERLRDQLETHFTFHGVHAQNYHVFTPAEGKDWAMVWGCQPWIKELPYANSACKTEVRPGEPGKLVLEFFVTPFDHAPDDPAHAVPSALVEGERISMSWAVLDYDDAQADRYDAFWNLSHRTTMYGDASDLVPFRLMPLEESLRGPLSANWTFKVIHREDRLVAFRDRSQGEITSWRWEFGDGQASDERNPIHRYNEAGEYIVTLLVGGPEGEARLSKIWDVTLP